jgi:hypothetical protein
MQVLFLILLAQLAEDKLLALFDDLCFLYD